jgi:hypothetical protein
LEVTGKILSHTYHPPASQTDATSGNEPLATLLSIGVMMGAQNAVTRERFIERRRLEPRGRVLELLLFGMACLGDFLASYIRGSPGLFDIWFRGLWSKEQLNS